MPRRENMLLLPTGFLREDSIISLGGFVVKRVRYGGILEIGYEDNQLVLVTKRLMVPSRGA